MASALSSLLSGYGSESGEEEEREEGGGQGPPQPRPRTASALAAMLPPPARPPAGKRTVGVGLANLLRSAELPSAGARARPPPALPMPEQRGELPPGFFDEGAPDEAIPVAEGASSGGISALLSLLPPPSRGRGAPVAASSAAPPAAAVAAPAPGPSADERRAVLPLPLARLPGAESDEEDEEEDEDEEENGGSGVNLPGAVGAAAYRRDGGELLAAGFRADAGVGDDDDDGDDGVTAPYPGGGGSDDADDDDGVTAPYPGGDYAAAGPRPPYARGQATGVGAWPGGGGPSQQQQQAAGMAVPAELLSRAERRALSGAQSGGCAMSSVDQSELRRMYGAAPEVVVPRPAADVRIEGRVFNRSTGAAEVTSKPTGGQKRKHQINQLAHQYLQAAPELDQRGRKGLKSKAETYGRYGW